MERPHIGDSVRLLKDEPEFMLEKGAVGKVTSAWYSPNVTYEVSFPKEHHSQILVVVTPDQIELQHKLQKTA